VRRDDGSTDRPGWDGRKEVHQRERPTIIMGDLD
jgi:hypothetical protein